MRSLRGRLAVTYLLVVLVALAAVDILVLGAIETFSLRQRDVAAFTSANIAANLVEPYYRAGPPSPDDRTGPLAAAVRSYAAQSGARVLALDRSGVVVADSQWPAGYAGRILTQPEVAQALAGKSSSGRRYLEGTGWVLYTVVPVLEAKVPVGAVFLSSSLDDLYSGLGSVARTMLAMSALALLVATLTGLGVARTITGPLDTLTRAVERMGKGDLGQRVKVKGRDEVATLSATFNDMAARLSDEDARRREFLADVAHELQTPVSAIRAMAEPLATGRRRPEGAAGAGPAGGAATCAPPGGATGADPGGATGADPGGTVGLPPRADYDIATYREMAKDMEVQAERLGRLVGDLLELARLDSPRVSLVREEVDLGALIAGVARSLEPAARDAGVTLEVGPLAPVTVIADGLRLEQVFLNLIGNGIKYAGPGKTVAVRLRARPGGHPGPPPAGSRAAGPPPPNPPSRTGLAVVTVSDDGPGIPPGDLEHIWDRFFRVERSRSRQGGGTGLGLAIVRRIVELHGGSVAARSAEGRGTEFEVRLPLAGSGSE